MGDTQPSQCVGEAGSLRTPPAHLQPDAVCLAAFDEVGDEEPAAELEAPPHAEAQAFGVQTVQAHLFQLSAAGEAGDGPALA